MGGEAQDSWSGSAGLNPAQTPAVLLSQASFPGGIKGQDNIHVGSSVTSREHQENTAWSWEHVSLHCGAESKGAVDPLCSLHVPGRWRHKPCPFTFLLSPPCTSAEGMNIRGVGCVSGAIGTQKCRTGLDHRAGNGLATWMNWREKVHQEL